MAACPLLSREAPPILSSSLIVHPLSDFAKQVICTTFLFLDHFKNRRILRQTQYLCPTTQCSIDCNLVVLHLLCCSNERYVSNRRIRDVSNDVRRLRGQPINDF